MEHEDLRLNFEQDCENARHYGQLRFAMFTVFSGIMGGLLSIELRKPVTAHQYLFICFRFAALGLALLFCLAQYRMSKLIVVYQERDHRLPPGHEFWKRLIPFIMMSPFLLAVLFWSLCLIIFKGQRIQ